MTARSLAVLQELLDLKKIVGMNLWGLLRNLDWGIPELVARTGYSPHFLLLVLRGQQNLTLDTLHVLAKALGTEAYMLVNARFEQPDRSALIVKMLEYSNQDISRMRARDHATSTRVNVARNLKQLMAASGHNCVSLASSAGVAASTIQKCLRGLQNITIDTLAAMAAGLGIEPFIMLLPVQE